jgi:hypothetical protein
MREGEAMAEHADSRGGRAEHFWRIAPWIIAALVLLLPLIAMQFTDEVVWDRTDFAVVGVMLFGACGAFEAAARMTRNIAYRAAIGVGLVTAFLLIWVNLAVGIIGSEDSPANLIYGGVLAGGILGAFMVRFQLYGMMCVLALMALAQALTGVIALAAGLGATSASWPGSIVALTAFFAALWLLSAWLFRKAAREQILAAGQVTVRGSPSSRETTSQILFQDQTEETEGNRAQQREAGP